MAKKMCALGCGHRVGNGDRHAVGFCPPTRGARGGRRDRARRRVATRREKELAVPIPGTGIKHGPSNS